DARLGEIRTAHVLDADRLAAGPDAEQQVPALGPPALSRRAMERHELVDEAWRAGRVRPGRAKRHEIRRMDAALGNMRELDELVLGGEAKLEPLRAQPQREEGRNVYCRTLT